jgi:hypothetical protein
MTGRSSSLCCDFSGVVQASRVGRVTLGRLALRLREEAYG